MDIVIGLDKIANVYKVVIDADEYLTPSKVTIRVGQGKLNEEVNYKNARTSKFQKPVILEFHRRERSVSRLESKSRNAFTDAVGQYIWITIEKPIPLSQNPHNQIEIKKLTVLGYPLPEELPRGTPVPESPKLEQNDEDVANLKMENLELESKGVPKKEKKIERHSMTESRKGVALRELYWKTLVLGTHYPAEFNGGRFRTPPGYRLIPNGHRYWSRQIANVYKVVIDADEYLTPSKVTIRVGQGKLNEEVNYKNARTSKFQKPVILEFHRRERSVSRLESKNAFTDAVGQYIWITIEKPIPLSQNPHNQIEIKKLTVLGYPLPEELPRGTPVPESPKLEQNDEDVANLKMENLELESKGVPKKEKKIERHSYEGDGMSMKEKTNLSEDPLTSIRTIRRVLEQKMEKANFDGKTIQATVCLRAIQRIDEYEARIEDLATRRSRALEAGDLKMAERHRLAMIDCRDTVFRAVHVDLLLDRDEVRF
ncbi:Protein CBG00537 [Caenorhabditis briggsae]|uniref:Protein CBG00537 n=1 Tax=Caenorhabditis briggsae TaxID=6238 RepID=E3CTV5_CAEBR|nr:Protein CBG00537 [Caenorhabditis briggsae]CBX32991.2 Protein CBG00537 [Caenorhabditis briggsae]